MTRQIYKLLTPAQWNALKNSGLFDGAPIDQADGYIHFSAKAQVEETAAKHFSAHETMILARCSAERFGDVLKWEVSRGGALFPHLYAALSLGEVERYWTISKQDGRFAFPADY